MNMRNEVIKEIKLKIVPELRNIGFTGSYPHFRRMLENGKDGNFYGWDEVTPEVIKKSTSVNTGERFRIESENGKWFEYDENNYIQTVENLIYVVCGQKVMLDADLQLSRAKR